jgi:UDP-N-acetyl-D-galactosamine dehydrogenase
MQPKDSRVLILGLTFKENCPDIRNTKVVDIIKELAGYGIDCDVHDPWVNAKEASDHYGLTVTEAPEHSAYDVVVVAVAHAQFHKLGENGIKAFGKPGAVIYDIKYLLPASGSDDRL